MPEEFRDASDDVIKVVTVFKKFGEGWYRVILVLWLPFAIFGGIVVSNEGKDFPIALIIPIMAAVYYVALRIILWIYLGFKKG